MKKLISILLVAVVTLIMTSCHRDQIAIERLNSIVTNFEAQYKQLSEEQMALVENDYAEAQSEVAQFRYSQADNERIGAIKARYDRTKLKYDVINAKRKVGDLFDQIVGYGEEMMNVLESDSI